MSRAVFSAVVRNMLLARSTHGRSLVTAQHFFKVGTRRAQGRAMVLCLAQQLAERLPGMAAHVQSAIDAHGRGEQLSLLQAFEAFLLDPLCAVEQQGPPPPPVLLLLDALDEADDAGKGWLAVATLVAKEWVP